MDIVRKLWKCKKKLYVNKKIPFRPRNVCRICVIVDVESVQLVWVHFHYDSGPIGIECSEEKVAGEKVFKSQTFLNNMKWSNDGRYVEQKFHLKIIFFYIWEAFFILFSISFPPTHYFFNTFTTLPGSDILTSPTSSVRWSTLPDLQVSRRWLL